MKSNAWIALSLTPALVLVGCKSEPEPVATVPPPAYAPADPEPLPPVSLNEGAAVEQPGSSTGGSVTIGPGAGSSYEPEPLPPAQPAARKYTIRKGDTLWAIARREYGNGQKWVDIAQANPSVDPKKLAIGQQITLP